MRLLAKLTAASLALTPLAACDSGSTEPTLEADDMDMFAEAGKTDTGYVSDQAAELEAELAGKVVIDLTTLDATEKARLIAAAKAGDKSVFATQPTEQVKFARNVLKEEKFEANVERGEAQITSLTLKDNESKLEIVYTVVVESLVKEKDLQADGLSLAQLVGRTVNMRLPADPGQAFEKGGISCAQDPDDPNENITTEIDDFNYFYYWMPDKETCALATESATFTVKNTAAAKPSYPEFDQLLADKKITIVTLFGQLEHGDLLSGQNDEWDWGWIGYEEFTQWLEDQGFTKKSQLPARVSVPKVSSSKWTKKYSAGMTVEIDVVSPLDLQDHADAAAKDALLANAVKTHEIVYYAGHSFYGSLKVLDLPENFPAYYQIVFMDSCWSYAYYTKQVFTSKATEADPTGMLKADVINNTEPGISGSHVTFAVFLKKFFTAANFVALKTPAKAKNYTWKNLISYMNTSAKKRGEEGGHDPEIFGVSGVSTNVWKP